MNRVHSAWISIALFVGLVLVFIGERLLAPESSHFVATGLGGALVVISLVVRVLRFVGSRDERRSVEGAFAALAVVGLAAFALALFFASEPRQADFPKLLGVLRALLPLLVVCCLLPTLFGELAYASMAQSERVESERVHSGIRSGLGFAFVLIFSFAAYYVAAERDAKIDLSYARAAKPGDATKKIVRALDEPVTVMTFYPAANDVGESVHEYLSALASESPNFKLERYDVAVDPEKAKALGVTGNGSVLVTRGQRKENMLIGLDIERARPELRSFDGDFQKRLLSVTRAKKALYLVAGHGEKSQEVSAGGDKRASLKLFVKEVEAMNHSVKVLGAAEGLGSEIPSDAAAVLVIGPQEALFPEEVAALHRYFDRGGRLFFALDPSAKSDWKELLAPFGLQYQPTLLANDRAYYSLTKQEQDRTAIATISFSSHPSVTTLSQLGSRAPMVLKEAGSLSQREDKPTAVSVDFTVHAEGATWNDANANYRFDSGDEVRKGWELSATVKKGSGESEGRALIVSDSDAFSDALFEFDGNYYFVRDGLKWVLSEESMSGEVIREQDVAIQHSRKQDVVWFYATVFLAPLLVLQFGWFASRKRRQSGGVRATPRKPSTGGGAS